jgi:ABC-type nitrate/sulfonate/bicarbonate transport system substrate-binding protein
VAAASRKIVIGQISPGTSQVPLFVAVERGFFTKAGLDVTIQSLSGGTPSAMASFATGDVNMLAGGAFEIIEYVGRKVIAGKIVGELADQNYDVVVAKGISAIEQLKGKTIGISGGNGADQIYLKAVLAKYGVSSDDVAFITSGATANRLTALSTGAIQGIVVSNAVRDMSNKVGVILLKSGDSPVKVPGAVMFASSDLVAKNRETLSKVVAAIAAATRWMRENPGLAAKDCAIGTSASVEACAQAIAINLDPAESSPFTWSTTNGVNTESISSALDVMAELVPETKHLTVNDIVDASIAGTTPGDI